MALQIESANGIQRRSTKEALANIQHAVREYLTAIADTELQGEG